MMSKTGTVKTRKAQKHKTAMNETQKFNAIRKYEQNSGCSVMILAVIVLRKKMVKTQCRFAPSTNHEHIFLTVETFSEPNYHFRFETLLYGSFEIPEISFIVPRFHPGVPEFSNRGE